MFNTIARCSMKRSFGAGSNFGLPLFDRLASGAQRAKRRRVDVLRMRHSRRSARALRRFDRVQVGIQGKNCCSFVDSQFSGLGILAAAQVTKNRAVYSTALRFTS